MALMSVRGGETSTDRSVSVFAISSSAFLHRSSPGQCDGTKGVAEPSSLVHVPHAILERSYGMTS